MTTPERPWTRTEMATATIGAASMLAAVLCVGFGRMDSAAWFAIATIAIGGYLYLGRRT